MYCTHKYIYVAHEIVNIMASTKLRYSRNGKRRILSYIFTHWTNEQSQHGVFFRHVKQVVIPDAGHECTLAMVAEMEQFIEKEALSI